MDLKKFKEEHAVVLRAVNELKGLVKGGISANADAIAKSIVSMTSAIKLHLAAEDRYLYPRLVNSADPAVAQLGAEFQQQMGGIAAAYMEFVGKWSLASAVVADPEGFRAGANGIFKALHERIQRENNELYPLVAQA